jgi:hypothetical protein
MTRVHLSGLIERENRTVLGIGWDSAVVLLVDAVAMSFSTRSPEQ